MAIKLITSKAYVDSIRNFLPEKPNSKSSASEKSDKIFNKIINSPNFIFDKNDEKITGYIKTLITIRPGRTLFKRILLKADKPLRIVYDAQKDSLFSYRPTETIITLNDSKVYHHISVNSDGEKFFSPTPGYITLAHELIHALHYYEDSQECIKNKKSKDILSPDFDNLEEQETIMGKEGEATLCENVFRFHFGCPLRINHRGIVLNKEDTFTASTCAKMGTLATLKEMLLSNPSLLNLSHPLSGTTTLEKMTPLNASLAANKVEISDYLFQVGVDVNAWDKYWGTSLHLAVHTKRLDLAKVLLENGADLNVKDPRGFTPLELAVDKKNAAMIALLAPLTNLKEID